MSAVILAVFGSFDAADRARLALVQDGFPAISEIPKGQLAWMTQDFRRER